jgi:hypothetical protein
MIPGDVLNNNDKVKSAYVGRILRTTRILTILDQMAASHSRARVVMKLPGV